MASEKFLDQNINDNMKETIFSYSDKLSKLIGKSLDDNPSARPVLGLDREGMCQFEPGIPTPQDMLEYMWRNIAVGRAGSIFSNYILLPDYWQGLIVHIELWHGDNNRDFTFRLAASDVACNKTLEFPITLRFQIEIELFNSKKFVSQINEFYIKGSDELFDCATPLENVNEFKLPNIFIRILE